MNTCLDCNCKISKKSIRCKSCANKHRWSNKNDIRRQKLIERNKKYKLENNYEDKEWLYQHYIKKELSIQEIANLLKCSKRTIARWLIIHNIKTRDISKSQKIIRNKKPKKINSKYICTICGNKKSYYAKNCTNCYNKRGENNPNYKGFYKISIVVRSWSKKYWRPKVLERDNYICQECNETDINLLQAHHIIHLSTIIEKKVKLFENKYQNKKDLYEKIILEPEIQSIENGITLCKECHTKKHKK